MFRQFRRRTFAAVFAVVLALVVGGFAYNASASVAIANIYTDTGSAYCNRAGTNAPAAYQGGTAMVKFARFWNETVQVEVYFPDGRIFTAPASLMLDGVIDQPVNNPADSQYAAIESGELAGVLNVPGEWPYGCYQILGRGLSSQKVAGAYLVVVPGGQPGANPGLAQMAVTRTGSNEAQGWQGSFVDVNGRGFRANEVISLWLTAPDGTVIDFPSTDAYGNPLSAVTTDDSGDFQAAFQFDGKNPVGTYQFTALGNLSGYRVISKFTLTSPPVQEQGFSQLSIAFPPDAQDPQRSIFEVQGKLFFPYEAVVLWATLPDGAVRELPTQFADEVGDFYAVLYLDERLPTGLFQVTAKGVDSGHLQIAGFNLEQTAGVQYNPDPGPEVIDANAGPVSEGSPPVTDDLFEQGNPGPGVP